jgi:hypothetical protein
MPSWKKVIVSGSDAFLNALTVTNGITGSLHGTASWARNATTASYVLNAVSSSFASTASYINPLNQLVIITGSLIQGLEGNIATGEYSHAEGSITQATGDYSHAEGDYTQAKGNYSHAEGQETIASGSYSHAEGYQTIALANHQHVQGQFNTVSSVPAAFIVGNGTDDGNRSNLIYAHDSTVEITGSLIVPSITGSLFGTASWAQNSITASYVLNAVSASFATTASYVLNAVSASYANFALTASYVNPLNQIVVISGSTRFDPTQDPDLAGSDLDSTYLFQSSSNTTLGYDLYFRQNGNLVKWKWVEGTLESGLLYGGVVTYSGSNVFVSPGSGLIVDHNATTGSEIGPIVDYVTWGPITQSIANISSSQVTYLYINDSGSLQQQSTRFTSEQYHNYIPLGAVGHFNFTNVSAFGGAVRTAYDQISQISDFIDVFGPIKVSGYDVVGQSGSLRLSVSSGKSFIHGGFYDENPEFPSNITTNPQPTASIAYVYRSGSGVQFDTNSGNLYTAVRPGFYDNGSGTPAVVSGGSYTTQRVFSDPKTGVLYIYYGQTLYSTLTQALTNIATDAFTEGDTFDFTTFVGFIILKGNTTDVTNTSDSKIIPAGLFRGSSGGSGGGGGGAETLGDLSDVSIVSPINGQALVYNSGIWSNNYPTSASFATTASYVLNAVSASFATNASIAQTAATASFVTASNVFGPFGSNSIISSSYALTASFALNGGGGGGSNPAVTHTQLTASTTWSFNHNLNTQTPLLQVYDLGYEQIIPNEIVSIDAFTSEIRFDYTQAGYAVASSGGGLIVTGSTARLIQTVAATTWSFAHNLGTKYPGFEIFNSNDDVIIPAGIHAVDTNNAEIYFAIPSTGIAIANFSGISGSLDNAISASYAATASYSDQFNIGQTQTQYATVTSSINGSNTVFTQATGSYTSAFFKYTVTSGSNARSGEIMSVWNGTTSAFTDNSTTDIGTTTDVTSSVAITGANVQLNMQTNSSGWRIKSIATFM